MPELPDVQVFKEYVDSTSLHKRIERTEVRDAHLLREVSAGTLRRQLNGTRLDSTRRHGKYLFARTPSGARSARAGDERTMRKGGSMRGPRLGGSPPAPL